MSTPKKLRAGTASEITRLKVIWRDSLAEDAREYWRSLFVSPEVSQAEIRKQLLARLKINLRFDSQLTKFRDWEIEQRLMDLEAERAAEEERRLLEEHPDWTKDQVRDDLLRRFYNRARATGDAKLGLNAMKQDRGLMLAALAREQFELEAAAKMLDKALRERADEINSSSLSQADKIAAMREAAFKDVEELQKSGRLKIPKA
ncbi:MAG: hypothetical protein KGL39_13280 [Patescibacteria group bacterium]|nr:hypothetical protein [Patescibacteria group bacterium]